MNLSLLFVQLQIMNLSLLFLQLQIMNRVIISNMTASTFLMVMVKVPHLILRPEEILNLPNFMRDSLKISGLLPH